MKILFVDQFSDIGGGQRCFLDLLPALEENGDVITAAIPGGGPFARLFPTRKIPCGPYRSGVKSSGDAIRFPFDLMGQIRILSELMDEGFDLLYVNGPRVLPATVLAAGGRTPILFHAHNRIADYWPAKLAGWSLRMNVNTVVACSEFVADPLRRCVRAGHIRIVLNGSRDMGYRERQFQSPLRIGVIGRIEPQKGQLDFIEAARQIPNAQFVVCGAHQGDYRRYYDDVRAAARWLPVVFCDWQDDMSEVFARLDLLVMASRNEGLPLVVLEAWSAGVPVIAYPVGGIPEVIEDNVTGFLVTEPSPRNLADRINQLTRSNSEQLGIVAGNARREWEQRFQIRRYQSQMIEALVQTANGTAARRPYRSVPPKLASTDTQSAR